MQDLCGTLDGFNLGGSLQSFYSKCHYPVEGFHAQVVILVLLKLRRGVDEMRRKLAVIVLDTFCISDLLAATAYSTVFGVALDTFHETLNGLGGEFQGILFVS